MRAGSASMLAMSAVRRRRRQSVLQVLVFSLTIMSLLTLALLRTDLIRDWQAQLPENTPNHFMMNITESQVDGMEAFLAQRDIATNAFYPMMTAGLVSVNGEPPRNPWDDDDDEGQQNLTERSGQLNEMSPQDGQSADAQSEGEEGERERVINRQVTYTDSLPPDNQIVAGEWWSGEDIAGQVSVEDDYASRLGVSLGDELVFRVGEDEVTVTVTSMRSVRWDNMQPNFFFIFSPGTLDYLGATYLSTRCWRARKSCS